VHSRSEKVVSIREEKSNRIFIKNYCVSLSLLPISKYIFHYITINICIFMLLEVLKKSLTAPMQLLFEFLRLFIKYLQNILY